MLLNNVECSVLAVSVSPTKGTKKKNVLQGTLMENYGLVGDGHANINTHRQISLLAIESIHKMREIGLEVNPGDFAENITTKGLEIINLCIGTKIYIGKNSILEVTQIGKECQKPCEIGRQVGKCIMPLEGIFCRVLSGGKIRVGDRIRIN